MPDNSALKPSLTFTITLDGKPYQGVMKALDDNAKETGRTVETLKGGISQMRDTMQTLASAAGAGPWAQLLSFTPQAMMMAATAIVAQAIRMAYVFQEQAAQVAGQMVTGGAGGFSGAFGALQGAATGPVAQRYGVDPWTAMAALGAYQGAAGATLPQTLRDQRAVLASARAFGLQPTEAATVLGGLTRITGETGSRAARSLFGGAEAGGQLGSDIRGYIQATQSVMATLAYGAPGRPMTTGMAASYVNALSGPGVYSTPEAVQTMATGLSGLTQGIPQDPLRMRLALRAGIPMGDIETGENRPEYQAAMLRQFQDIGGGDWNNPYTQFYLAKYMGQSAARLFYGRGQMESITRKLGTGLRNKELDAADIDPRAQAAMDTDWGQMAKYVAKWDDEMVAEGDRMLGNVDWFIDKVHLDDAMAAVIYNLPKIAVLLAIAAGVQGIVKISGLLKGGAAAAAAGEAGEAAVATGGGAAIIGGLAIPVGIGGALMAGKAWVDEVGRSWSTGYTDPSNLTPQEVTNPSYWQWSGVRGTRGFGDITSGQRAAIIAAAKRFNIDPRLLYGEYYAESSLGKTVGDPRRSMGLISGIGHYAHYGYQETSDTLADAMMMNAAMWADARQYLLKHGIAVTMENLVLAHEQGAFGYGYAYSPAGANPNKIRNLMTGVSQSTGVFTGTAAAKKKPVKRVSYNVKLDVHAAVSPQTPPPTTSGSRVSSLNQSYRAS